MYYNLCDILFVFSIVTLDAFELHVSTRNRVPLTREHHGQDVSGVSAGLSQNVLLHTLQSTSGQPRRTYIQGIYIIYFNV